MTNSTNNSNNGDGEGEGDSDNIQRDTPSIFLDLEEESGQSEDDWHDADDLDDVESYDSLPLVARSWVRRSTQIPEDNTNHEYLESEYTGEGDPAFEDEDSFEMSPGSALSQRASAGVPRQNIIAARAADVRKTPALPPTTRQPVNFPDSPAVTKNFISATDSGGLAIGNINRKCPVSGAASETATAVVLDQNGTQAETTEIIHTLAPESTESENGHCVSKDEADATTTTALLSRASGQIVPPAGDLSPNTAAEESQGQREVHDDGEPSPAENAVTAISGSSRSDVLPSPPGAFSVQNYGVHLSTPRPPNMESGVIVDRTSPSVDPLVEEFRNASRVHAVPTATLVEDRNGNLENSANDLPEDVENPRSDDRCTDDSCVDAVPLAVAVPHVDTVMHKDKSRMKVKCCHPKTPHIHLGYASLIAVVGMLALVATLAVILSGGDNGSADVTAQDALWPPSKEPTLDRTRQESIQSIVAHLSGDEVFDINGLEASPDRIAALDWLVWLDPFQIVADDIELEWKVRQRYIVALLYFSTNGAEWTEQLGFLSGRDECDWVEEDPVSRKKRLEIKGVLCDSYGRIQTLDIYWNNLTGTLPKELSHLSDSLVVLNLVGGSISSKIPSSLGNLSRLEHLNVSENCLSGTIPENFSELENLKYAMFQNNNDLVGNLNGVCNASKALKGNLGVITASCGDRSGREGLVQCDCCICCDSITFDCHSKEGNTLWNAANLKLNSDGIPFSLDRACLLNETKSFLEETCDCIVEETDGSKACSSECL